MAPSAPKASSSCASSSMSAWRGAKATTTHVPRYSEIESGKRLRCPRTKASPVTVGAAVPVTYSMEITIGAPPPAVIVAVDDLRVVLADDGSLVWRHGCRTPQNEDRRNDRTGLVDPRSGAGA